MSVKLNFEENTKAKKVDCKVSKTELKADKYSKKQDEYRKKQDEYRKKQPTRKRRVHKRRFDEKKGKVKTRLIFEQETIAVNEAKWNKQKKRSIPRAAAASVITASLNKLHSKVYEVEHENVGAEAGHKAELISESVCKEGKKVTGSAYRYLRNSPYRQEAKFEVKSIKERSKLEYQKALRDNPNMRSNPISRFRQKRIIRKKYADALRNVGKSGKSAKKTTGAVKKTGQAITNSMRKNPVLLVKASILLLIIFMIMALLSMCATLFSGGTAFVGSVSYAAADEDINQTELLYTELETDLLLEALNAETSHSGYNEYRYNIGSAWHNPLELMGFLTAVYEDFTYQDIESDLLEIFSEQYQLAFEPEIEVRTRTETRSGSYTDEVGNSHSYSYTVQVQYNWHILNVILTSQLLSSVINPRMNDEQLEHFAVLMESRGIRQFAGNPFDFDLLPYITSNFGYRVHPITGIKDYHKGIDIGMPTGTEIRAGFDGTVTAAAYDSSYGNHVVIEKVTNDGTVIEAKYDHCHTLLASVGQSVAAGEVIATVGSTGSSTGAHLHMEVLKDGIYMNPIYYAVTQSY